MATAEFLIAAGEVWLWIGAAVAAAFLLIGIDRIDENARGSYVFRPLLIPGVLLLWPLVLGRWAVLELGLDRWEGRHLPPRAAQGWVWAVAAAAMLAVIATGFAIRQAPPESGAAVRVEAER